MRDRKLTCTIDFSDDDSHFNLEEEFLKELSDQISAEIDAEIIKELLSYDKKMVVEGLSEVLPSDIVDKWDVYSGNCDDIDKDLFCHRKAEKPHDNNY
jgi:hypothetical protein